MQIPAAEAQSFGSARNYNIQKGRNHMAQRLDVQYVQFYTDGSAARKVAPLAPLKTMKLPQLKKTKRIVLHIDPVAIAGICMAVFMIVLMVVGAVQLTQQRRQLSEMTLYVENLQTENQILEDRFEQKCDLEQIENTARALGLVPKEEVRHVTISAPDMIEQDAPNSWERFYIFLTGLFA